VSVSLVPVIVGVTEEDAKGKLLARRAVKRPEDTERSSMELRVAMFPLTAVTVYITVSAVTVSAVLKGPPVVYGPRVMDLITTFDDARPVALATADVKAAANSGVTSVTPKIIYEEDDDNECIR
jgi:hypothetical protein